MKKIFGGKGMFKGAGRAIAAFAVVLGLAGLVLFSSARQSSAQLCEDPISMAAEVQAAVTVQVNTLLMTFLSSQFCPTSYPPCGVLPNIYAIEIENTQNFLLASLDVMEDTILDTLKKFWDNWLLALKDQTAQLSGSLSDGTRHLDSLFDSSNETQNERLLQETEGKAKKQYQTTDQGCRFDTAARTLNSTMRTAKFVSQGIAKDLAVQGSNEVGTAGEQGRGQEQKSRYGTYQSTFCDPNNNAGYAGCTTAGTLPNADTLPAKTLFGKETIDWNSDSKIDKDERAAIEALTYNITGFDVPSPFPLGVIDSPAGKQQRARDREYLAQMDAVGSLVTSLVGERMPSAKPTPEVQQLRQKLGVTDASDHASEREIRQSVVEQLWDPNYWVDLGDSPGTTAQKEVYLQAYNLLMLYKIIGKTEKIANAYAIETANMLDRQMGSVRGNGSEYAPLR